jgi:hypothetical protein
MISTTERRDDIMIPSPNLAFCLKGVGYFFLAITLLLATGTFYPMTASLTGMFIPLLTDGIAFKRGWKATPVVIVVGYVITYAVAAVCFKGFWEPMFCIIYPGLIMGVTSLVLFVYACVQVYRFPKYESGKKQDER